MAREATDVLILPEVDAIEIRDWKAYEPAVAAGYRAARRALDRLKRPVIELRRRPGSSDAAELADRALISAG